MAKYHINQSTGRPSICRAKKQPCPLKTEGGEQVPHFDSKEEAREYAEKQDAEKFGTFSTVKKQRSDENDYVVGKHGKKMWFNSEGDLHREGAPAVIWKSGTKEWYRNGDLHREDGPASIHSDGTEFWYKNGKFHRENGPAIIEADGYRAYYVNGQLHREDGPAIERADGYKAYYVNGKRHREDGPAVTNSDGSKEYWLNGKRVKPF